MSEADRYFIKKGFSKVIKQGIEEFTDDDGNYIHFDLVIERFTCNCYLSAKELQAINKKVEELRMDMSNKTSDGNVANEEITNNKNKYTYIKEVAERIANEYREKYKDEKFYPEPSEQTCMAYEILHLLAEREQMLKTINTVEKEKGEWIKAYQEEKDKQFNILINSIPKQKIKDLLTEIQEEYNKLDKEIDKQIKDKNKDYYKCKENIAIMQTLAYCRDKFEGLLEEK